MHAEAERQLLGAILLRAVRDFTTYHRARNPEEQLLLDEARAWLFAPSEQAGDFTSFHSICWLLGLDTSRVRQRILGLVGEDLPPDCGQPAPAG